MAVLLSLAAAIAYGLSDFVGGIASRRTSAWAVAFASQLGGALAVLVLTLVVDGEPTRADAGWAVLAGAGNGVGTAFLYRGLSSGRMGVVAPISGVGAALLPVVVGLATGERPSALAWCGLLAALPAIWLVAREPAPAPAPDGSSVPATSGSGASTRSAVVDGVLAGFGFGTLFAALAQIPESSGFLPLVLNQLVGGVVVAAVATALGAPWVPRETAAALGVVSGCLGASATGLFLLATQQGYLTISAVVTSLYPAFTVVLAALVLRERVHRGQAVGLLLCAGAVALIAGG